MLEFKAIMASIVVIGFNSIASWYIAKKILAYCIARFDIGIGVMTFLILCVAFVFVWGCLMFIEGKIFELIVARHEKISRKFENENENDRIVSIMNETKTNIKKVNRNDGTYFYLFSDNEVQKKFLNKKIKTQTVDLLIGRGLLVPYNSAKGIVEYKIT